MAKSGWELLYGASRLRPGTDDILNLLDDSGEEPLREDAIGEDRDYIGEHLTVPTVARAGCAITTEK